MGAGIQAPRFPLVLVELLNLTLKDKIMKRKRFLLGRGGCLLLLLAILLVFGAANAFAIPLTGVSIGWDTSVTGYNGWYTNYTFDADQLDGPLEAFCVQNTPANQSYTYELIPVDSSINPLAVKIADYYFSNSGLIQRDFQIAIWHAQGVVSGGLPPSSEAAAQGIYNGTDLGVNWSNYVLNPDRVSLAHSPYEASGATGDSQDYLVSVPEPATLLLLGTGMLGIAVVGRKKRFKK